MAIYHLHCDIIGRSGGRSVTAAAAYRATCKIEDRTTGETFDFSRKEKAIFSMILTNKDVPEWAKDRSELWNSCEEKENRKNSQFCRSFDLALMKELSWEENAKLVVKWWYENYGKRGLVGDFAIHAAHKNRDGTTNENLHAHILIPTRKMNKDGWTEKDREGNDREFLEKVRKSWADIVNAKFKELGMPERIDERTLEEQGIDREPQQHQGVTATAMERKKKDVRRKKYKSQEERQQTQHEIEVEEIIVNSALHTDPEYIKLKEQKDKIEALQKNPEFMAQRKFDIAQREILSKASDPQRIREGVKVFVNATQREEFFYYIKHNTQDELNYLESKKSNHWRDQTWNKSLDEKKKTVRDIAVYPQWDRVIYPKVDKYYNDSFSFSADMDGSHKSRFMRWVETTDFLPVKVCRLAIHKLRQWRDEHYPKQTQSQGKGWSRRR